MGLAKEKNLDISILPKIAQREVIDFFEFMKSKHIRSKSENQSRKFKAIKIRTKGFKFDRETANER